MKTDDLKNKISALEARVAELESANRNVFRNLSSFKEDNKELYIVIAEYGTYTLMYHCPASEIQRWERGVQWIVAKGYSSTTGTWESERVFDIYADAIVFLFQNEPILKGFKGNVALK